MMHCWSTCINTWKDFKGASVNTTKKMNNAYSQVHRHGEGDVSNITDTNLKGKETKSNESKKCIFHDLGPVASESLSRLDGQPASGLPAWGSWTSFTVCVMRAFRQSPGSHAIRLPSQPANTPGQISYMRNMHMPYTQTHCDYLLFYAF